MEQNNKAKMEMVSMIVKKGVDDINNKFDTLFEELLTEDIKKMVISIMRINHIRFVQYKFNEEHVFCIGYCGDYSTEISCFSKRTGLPDCHFYGVCDSINYSTNDAFYLEHLERASNKIKKEREKYDLLYNEIDNIVMNITKQYEDCMINQEHRMDAILSNLGVNVVPIKHIKITVEYI